ncbi:hypothetical protein V8E53_012958 [Lactarius tabidus]
MSDVAVALLSNCLAIVYQVYLVVHRSRLPPSLILINPPFRAGRLASSMQPDPFQGGANPSTTMRQSTISRGWRASTRLFTIQ